MITITEVLGKAAQGRTEPFICRGDDDQLYYVKGRNAGYRSLCCEWVVSHLARQAGLVVPDFTIAQVPRALVAASDREDIRHLGEGPVFASSQVTGAREIAWNDLPHLNSWEMAKVLFFDLWVQNEDRTLSVLGGNPNLLITHEAEVDQGEATDAMQRCLWVIDFNLSFDELFVRSSMLEHHVFGQFLGAWPEGFREHMTGQLTAMLASVPRLFSQLPDDWLYPDGDDSLPVHLDQNQVLKTLQLPLEEPEAFWTLP
ncbi:MAG: HipA family kinase [Prosthecobacter sp.]